MATRVKTEVFWEPISLYRGPKIGSTKFHCTLSSRFCGMRCLQVWYEMEKADSFDALVPVSRNYTQCDLPILVPTAKRSLNTISLKYLLRLIVKYCWVLSLLWNIHPQFMNNGHVLFIWKFSNLTLKRQ